jgi:hypothetical protein
MLVEAVIAMALAGILAAGPAYMMSKVTASGTQSHTEIQSIVSMRNILAAQTENLCSQSATPQINLNGNDVKLVVHCELPEQITVGPVTVVAAKPKVSLSVVDEQSFGSARPLVVSE